MGNTGAREERELQALIRKIRKHVKKTPGSNHEEQEDVAEKSSRRFVDTAGERDVLVQDASADEIFREMKRRDF